MEEKQVKAKPVRPFSMEYMEAKDKIIKSINEATQIHGVPFYLLEELIADISHQIQANAKAERERAKITYEQQLAEYKKAEG